MNEPVNIPSVCSSNMLGVVNRNSLPMATLCMEQREVSLQSALLQVHEACVAAAVASVPCAASEDAQAASQKECPSRTKTTGALLQLLNKSGATPTAQKMALNLLMELVRREPGKLGKLLYSKIFYTLVECGSSLVDLLVTKYSKYADIRYYTYVCIYQLARKHLQTCSEDGKEGARIKMLNYLYELLLDSINVDMEKRWMSANTGALPPEEKALKKCRRALDRLFLCLDLQHGVCNEDRILPTELLADNLIEEDERFQHGGCCEVNKDNGIQEPDPEIMDGDISDMLLVAARGKGGEAINNVNKVSKTKVDEEEDLDDEEDQEDEADSGDGGDSDEAGGDENEGAGGGEDEEDEDEDEEEDGGANEEEEGEAPKPPEGFGASSGNVVNVNDVESEEEEEESDDGGEGGVVEDEEDDDDDEDDDEDAAEPPKKKVKK